MKLVNILRRIKKSFSRYRPSVEIFISRKKLLHNLHEYQQQYPQLLFAPVLKSNAYGHGLSQVASILDGENIPFLVVDSLFEAKVLRNDGIKTPILIIGYTRVENINSSKVSNTVFTITSLEQLKEINNKLKASKKFHLKIDTGMHRQGILMIEIGEAIKIIKNNERIILEGICSHLADADNMDERFTQQQIVKWKEAVEIFKQNFAGIKFLHLSATAGTKYADQIPGNMVRLGIGLYGINVPFNPEVNLEPVLEMRSLVSSVKMIGTGESVGYNAIYKTDKITKIASVPVGYFEGIDRRLASGGFLKVKGIECPIVGKVSMNITTLDITSISGVELNDSVTIISSDAFDKNSVENVAKIIGTIPYEILIHIPSHLRRIIYD